MKTDVLILHPHKHHLLNLAAGAVQSGRQTVYVTPFYRKGLGALVAGSRAGLSYNTWPLMDGSFMPPWAHMTNLEPAWRNWFENVATVQFLHRLGAYALLALALWHALKASRLAGGTSAARRAWTIVGMVLTQAGLGIATLYAVNDQIPLGLGLAHQGFAMLVLGMGAVHWRKLAV